MKFLLFFILLIVCVASSLHAEPQISVYFSPHGGCTEAIVQAIGHSKKSILVEAYSFTSTPIAKALIAAHQRGAQILVLLDRSELSDPASVAPSLHRSGIPLFIDSTFKIAHSKVMILDLSTVITGSFNFTKSAETSNSENLLVISDDSALVNKYSTVWKQHRALSMPYSGQRVSLRKNHHHKAFHTPLNPLEILKNFFHPHTP